MDTNSLNNIICGLGDSKEVDRTTRRKKLTEKLKKSIRILQKWFLIFFGFL
jgi:hypothetical protein